MNKKIDKSLNTSLDFFKTLDAGLTGDKSNNPINISEEHVGNITNGRVVAAHGRQYVVQLNDGRFLPSFHAAKKVTLLVAILCKLWKSAIIKVL